MKCKYIGAGSYYPGLPACDLDEKDLSDSQIIQLADGIAAGMYTPVIEKPTKAAKITEPSIPEMDRE
jgi:hypothetical protein